jgi:hypothetical protein
MTKALSRVASPAFWKTGAVVVVALLVVIGIQATNMVTASEAAIEAANASTRDQYPTESWAFDMLERCRMQQGEFVGSKVTLMEDCDRAVILKAREQGVEKAVQQAFAAKDEAVGSALKGLTPNWPLSAVHQPLWRMAVWLFT